MLRPNTLNRVSDSYRRGYYDGFALKPHANRAIPVTDHGIPMKPFSDFDYAEGRAAGLNDYYWQEKRAGRITEARSDFLARYA